MSLFDLTFIRQKGNVVFLRLLHHSVVINTRGNSYRLRGRVGKEGVEMSQS